MLFLKVSGALPKFRGNFRGVVMNELAVILMGSKSDAEHSEKISKKLNEFGIASETKIASAHKNTELLLQTIKQFDSSGKKIVSITPTIAKTTKIRITPTSAA